MFKLIKILTIPVILTVYLNCSAAISDIRVNGIVVDKVNSLPLGNTEITVNNSDYRFSSSEDGMFNFKLPESGEYNLEFKQAGYKPFSVNVNSLKDSVIYLLIELTPLTFETPLIPVTDEKGGSKLDDLLELSNTLKDKELQNKLGQTVASTLKDETGLSMQSMGPAPSRPVYRGLSGDRVMITEDGVKTTDLSATSPDHAVTIDPFSLQSIEVIRGPKVLLKSSTTIGGIINAVRNEIPSSLSGKVNLNLGSFYESSNKGYLFSGVIQIPVSNFEFQGEGNYRNTSDISSPEGVLENTAIKTSTYCGGLSYIHNYGFTGISFRQYNSDYGIPGGFIGAHPNGVDITMQRDQLNFRLNQSIKSDFIDYIDTDLSFVKYKHTEYESPELIGAEFRIKDYLGFMNLYHDQFGSLKRGILGVSFDIRDFNIGGFVFTPPSVSNNLSVYFNEEIETIGKFNFEFSGRYSYNYIYPEQNVTLANLDSVYSRVFNTFSLSASAVYEINENLNIGINLSRSSRVPTIEELYSDGPHLAAYSYEIGNPALEDEKGFGSEIFLYYNKKDLYGMLTLFYNNLSNYIIPRNTGEINYATLLPIYQTAGVNANLLGLESQIEYNFFKNFNFNFSLSYTYGQIIESESPLPKIPPLKSLIELNYTKNNYYFGINSEMATAQNRVDEFEEPTAGYIIFGATAQYSIYKFKTSHNFSLNFENLTNAVYRNHLSRIKSILPEPGIGARFVYKFFF